MEKTKELIFSENIDKFVEIKPFFDFVKKGEVFESYKSVADSIDNDIKTIIQEVSDCENPRKIQFVVLNLYDLRDMFNTIKEYDK